MSITAHHTTTVARGALGMGLDAPRRVMVGTLLLLEISAISERTMNELSLDRLDEDWAAVKLLPRHTGLQRAIWITENQGYQHDIRVKVSTLRSGRGLWIDAVSVSVRPICEEIVPPGHRPLLPSADLAQVCRWIALNRDVILDFWDGTIAFDEATARLQKLP